MKLNKSEELLLDIIDGKKHFKHGNRNQSIHGPSLKRVEKAIDSLKAKGLIEKGKDNILKRVEQ